MDIFRFNLAEGLKKAGTFGGTFSVKDTAGTNNLVFPSMASTISPSFPSFVNIMIMITLLRLLKGYYIIINNDNRLNSFLF